MIILRNLRIRDRQPDCYDKCFNIICCKFPLTSRNTCVTSIMLNEKCVNTTMCTIGFILVIGSMTTIIYLLITTPWVFAP